MAINSFQQQCWIFQRHPGRFDWMDRKPIAAAFEETKSNYIEIAHRENWAASRYFRQMQEGDIAFFWVSGSNGGIEGWGVITHPAEQNEEGDWRIWVNASVLLRVPISRNRVANSVFMGRHALFTGGAAGTNHRVTPAQAFALSRLFEEDGYPLPRFFFDEGLTTILDVVNELELEKPLSEETEQLLNIAALSSQIKRNNVDKVSATTVFLAACAWGAGSRTPDGDTNAPRVIKLLGQKVEDLFGEEDLRGAVGEYFSAERDLAYDDIAYFDTPPSFSSSVEDVLKACAQTSSTQISLLLLLRTLINSILQNAGTGRALKRAFPQLEEAGETLVKSLISSTSAHVESDRWTTSDELGYFDYAVAFEMFLRSPETKPPMTISIQAPWGGGKTSLMRMIQELIDPTAPGLDLPPKDEDDSKQAETDREFALRRRGEGRKPALTLAQAEERIDKPLVPHTPDQSPSRYLPPPEQAPKIDKSGQITTIWFNAWTFQNHDQIWAGLASAIIEGLSDCLSPLEREKFLLALNAKRFDRAALRDKIHRTVASKAASYVLKGTGLLFVGIGAAVGALIGSGFEKYLGALSLYAPPTGFALGSVIAGWLTFLAKKKSELAEPADIQLGEFFKVPDYASNKGFIADVSDDLRKALSLVPTDPETGEPKPIVIFIDDLDRCPPGKIAELFEAINLFLAGEFPNCIIVLGMDSEIVAASLAKTHSEISQYLGTNTSNTALGWRYMDKFVQLPFVVPSIGPEQVEAYMAKLVAAETGISVDEVEFSSTPDDGPIENEDKPEGETETEIVEVLPTPAPPAPLTKQEKRAAIEARIATQSREANDVRDALVKAQVHFTNNPRALKRLANVFRFYMNLRAAREEQDQEVPAIAQLQNWVILMLRWPDFFRWLRSECFDEQALGADAPTGENTLLARIENADGASFEEWSKAVIAIRPDAKDRDWLKDPLWRFFQRLKAEGAEGSLAAGAGRGFW